MSDTESPLFIHSPLKSLDGESGQIRLLHLLPAIHHTDDVCCELYHVSLRDKPVYEALSYAWGDASVTAPICIGDGK